MCHVFTLAMWYLYIKTTDNPRGVLNFHFGMSVCPEGPKIGAQRTEDAKFGVLKNSLLVQFEALGTEI